RKTTVAQRTSSTSLDKSLRNRSCMAALEIVARVTRFNTEHPNEPLRTRLGLHAGQLSVSRDLDGEKCTLVGHAVMIAKRFEELGKTLLSDREPVGSPILASNNVVEDLDDIVTRYLGHHELKGVGRVAVYQLIGEKHRTNSTELELCHRFA